MDEGTLLRAVLRGRPVRPGLERIGPGDDAAVLRWRGEVVVSVDVQVEGVHFRAADVGPRAVGYRAAAAALSDLAAMGAAPRAALASLAVPRSRGGAHVRALARGLKAALRRHRVALVGGNLTTAPGAVHVAVTVLGEVRGPPPMRRTGARPGDRLWLTGPVGRAALARHALAAGAGPRAAAPFLRPEPRLACGLALRRRRLARAAIDVSDGLLGDLAHLLPPPLGARLDWEALRPGPPFCTRARRLGLAPEELVLRGGEDYELLFAAPAEATPALTRLARRLKLPFRCIGEVCSGGGIRLHRPGGREQRLAATAYRHRWRD